MAGRALINSPASFCAPQPEATIAIGQEVIEGEPRMFIKDNGVGFDMIESHRLFGAFRRLHSQSEFVGAVIALAPARRVVNRHGGLISAEGEVGEGAKFYTVL